MANDTGEGVYRVLYANKTLTDTLEMQTGMIVDAQYRPQRDHAGNHNKRSTREHGTYLNLIIEIDARGKTSQYLVALEGRETIDAFLADMEYTTTPEPDDGMEALERKTVQLYMQKDAIYAVAAMPTPERRG